jgi:hypothetical protein
MIRIFRVAAIGVGMACLANGSAQAQMLWQNSGYQMSADDVLKAVPGSARHTPKQGENLNDGAVELVEGPVTNIVSHEFLPEFYFNNGKLEQVTLRLQGVDTATEARIVYRDLVTALRAKYGNEVSGGPTSIGLSSEWVSGKANISMILVAITESNPILNICYQVRLAGDASKL